MCCSALSISRWIASRRYLTLAPIFKKSGGCRKSRRGRLIDRNGNLQKFGNLVFGEKCVSSGLFVFAMRNPFAVALLPA